MFDAPAFNRPAPATSQLLAGPVQVCCSQSNLYKLELSESQPLGAVVSAPFWMPCGLGSDPTTAESHELATHGKRAEVGMNETVDWSPIEPQTWHAQRKKKKKFSHENDDSEKKNYFGFRFTGPHLSHCGLFAGFKFTSFYPSVCQS